MNDQNGTTTLPSEVTDALASAYTAYSKAVVERSPDRPAVATHLANLAAAGRKAGWSVRALADPCGITPERLRQIIKEHADGQKVTSVTFPKFSRARKADDKPRTKRSHLSEADAAELKALAPQAKMNTGSRPLTSPVRKASEKFSRLIIKHHKRGVVWREIAEATDGQHTVSGLRMRAARHGYGKGAPPSIQPYRRVAIHGAKKVAPHKVEKEVERAKASA